MLPEVTRLQQGWVRRTVPELAAVLAVCVRAQGRDVPSTVVLR